MNHPSPTDQHSLPPLFRIVFRVRLALLFVALLSNILILTQFVDVVTGVIVFGAAVLAYAILTILFWKCPHCRKYPGNAVMPDYCEKCGTTIFGIDAQVPARETGTEKPVLPLRYLVVGRGLYGTMLLLYFVIFASQQAESPFVFWAGALTFLGFGAWLEWRWWRCPRCGGYLKRSLWPGRTCIKCGSPLEY